MPNGQSLPPNVPTPVRGWDKVKENHVVGAWLRAGAPENHSALPDEPAWAPLTWTFAGLWEIQPHALEEGETWGDLAHWPLRNRRLARVEAELPERDALRLAVEGVGGVAERGVEQVV